MTLLRFRFSYHDDTLMSCLTVAVDVHPGYMDDILGFAGLGFYLDDRFSTPVICYFWLWMNVYFPV